MSAIHRCLLIREILYKILSQDVDDDFEPDGWSHYKQRPNTKHMLAVLARTCRLFSDLALNILWAELDSLDLLIDCFPEDIWTESDNAVNSVRSLRPTDWIIFQKYARRVKKLEISSGSSPDDDLFFVFSFAPPSLFPNLRHLKFSNPTKGWPYFLRCFIGPRLIRLDMELVIDPEEERRDMAFMLSLGVVSPVLEHVKFVSDMGRAEYPQNRVSRDLICGWGCLQDFTCDTLESDALTHLAHLESLRSLSFTVDSPQVFRNLLAPSSSPIFTNLRDLTLHPIGSAGLNSSISFLKSLPSALVALQMYPVENLNLGQHDLQGLLHVVDSMDGSHEIMERLSVMDNKECFPAPAQETAVDFGAIRTILTFRNLREVDIDTIFPLSLNDDTLKEVARAWPKLRKLSLGALHGCRGHSQVTLDGLTTLLEFCPELEDLGIVVNAVGSGRPPKHGVYNHNITVLKLGDSNITSAPIHVAAFLSVIVPQVRVFRIWEPRNSFGPDLEEHKVRGIWWSIVMQLLRSFAKAKDPGVSWESRMEIMRRLLVDCVNEEKLEMYLPWHFPDS